VPALPNIAGSNDIILDIYTHSSLMGSNMMNPEYGDTNRLAELGRKVLDMALAVHLFSRRPMLDAEEISSQSKTAVSDANLRDWITAYGIKTRGASGPCDITDSVEGMRNFFHAYIGALHIRNGINEVQAWVSALVDPDAGANSFAAPQPPGGVLSLKPLEPNAGVPLLARLNQIAIQKGHSVAYPAEQTGPAHAPTWTVTCQIDNVDKGKGVARKQRLAKQEAAQNAMQAMNWQ
ncbi:hypothetical protein C8R43DRAFT_876006, partial [Mycena crocata]